MRLKDRNNTPVGGFYYDDPVLDRRISTDGNFKRLVSTVRQLQLARGFEVDNLEAFIEDQICTRQPAGRCYYTKGIGDMISRAVHTVAAGVDKVAGTQLEKRARGCSNCGRRRASLNSITKS